MALGKLAAAGIAVVACSESGTGGGTFRLAATLATPVHPNDLAVADLDGDGDLDAAAAGFVQPTLQLYENRGGRLQPAARIETSAGVLSLIASDLDGDGRFELIATETAADRINIYRPDLDQPVLLRSLEVDSPDSVWAEDFDGDGRIDLAVSRFVGDEVVVLAGSSDLAESARLAVPGGPTALRTIDLGGRPALVVLSSRGNRVTVWSPATWTLERDIPTCAFPAGIDVVGARAAVACSLSDSIAILDVAASDPTVAEVAAGTGPLGVAIGNLGGASGLDVAIANKFEDTIAIAELGDDAWSTVEVPGGPTPVRAADIDGDGTTDLVTVSGFSDRLHVLERAP